MEEIKISQNLSKEEKYIELVNQINLLIKDLGYLYNSIKKDVEYKNSYSLRKFSEYSF